MTTNKYVKWTDEDIKAIQEGIIPPGRNYKDCVQKCRSLGIKFRKQNRRNGWTDDEINMARKGILPPGKSYHSVAGYCKSILGFSFIKAHKNSPWTEEELAALERGEKPVSRTLAECKLKRIKGDVASAPKDADERVIRGESLYKQMLQGHSLRDIGKMNGLSGERVRQLINLYKNAIE